MKYYLILPVFFLFTSSTDAAEPTRMSLPGQLHALAAEIRDIVQRDTILKGRKLLFGKVVNRRLANSTYELRLETELRELLKDLLASQADFTLSAEYDYRDSDGGDNAGLKVVQLTLVIEDSKGKEVAKKVREVNDTADIAKIVGITLSLPDVKDFAKRNEAAKEAQAKPDFQLLEGTRVAASGNPRYAVELRKRAGGQGAASAVVPVNQSGLAFAELALGDTYEVVLFNHDTIFDAVAELTIDGLDAANSFNTDGVRYPGYFIPRAKDGKPGEHVVPGWLHTAKKANDNVFVFVVNELGKGAASAKQVRGRTGVVSATFRDACEPNEQLRARSFGETGKGDGMRFDYQLKNVQVGSVPLAIVHVRYTHSP